jgi:predicted hotdog family 3-hydroxylacyl-ACP dehydratase
MNYPVLTSQLTAFLPHRAPMIWVDSVLGWSIGPQGVSGTCSVTLRSDQLYYDQNGELLPSAAIEWIAQSWGYVKACQAMDSGALKDIGRAFLVGVNECSVNFKGVAKNTELRVFVEEFRSLPPACIVQGRVTNIDATIIYGTAKIKVFAD